MVERPNPPRATSLEPTCVFIPEGEVDAPPARRGETVHDVELACLGRPQVAGSIGRLDHYEVLGVIGRGGMGLVLCALDTTLGRIVALKILGAHLTASTTARQRFIREARIAAAVQSEHVVGIHSVVESGPVPYLVLEHIAGSSLEQHLRTVGGPLPVAEIIALGRQIASGLAAAHARGVVHRDIKPANVLLAAPSPSHPAANAAGSPAAGEPAALAAGSLPSPLAKITDFGLARAVDDATLTQLGTISGTPLYMAPEQARGEPVDHRADLFSLGSLLYVLCTGRPPFQADNSMAILKRVCEEEPQPIANLNPEVPQVLCAIIARLHAKSPTQRFQSAAEVAGLLACLEGVSRDSSGSPSVTAQLSALIAPPRPATRWPRLIAATLVLLLLMAGGLVWRFWLAGEPISPGQPVTSLGEQEKKRRAFLETWPADALKRAAIPPELLARAGGGDPSKVPPEIVAILGHEPPRPALAVAVHPNGRILAEGGVGGIIRLWDLETGKALRFLSGHSDDILHLAFNPRGDRLASGSADKRARLWNTPEGILVQEWRHEFSVRGMAFNHDGQVLACGITNQIVFWDAVRGDGLLYPIDPSKGRFHGLAFSKDGRYLATTGHEDGLGRIWDMSSGKEPILLPGLNGVERVAFRPDSKLLVTVGKEEVARRWNLDGQELPPLRGHKGKLRSVSFSPDGRLLATCGADGMVWLWDLSEEPPARRGCFQLFPPGQVVADVAFTPDGRHLVTANPDGSVYVLRLAEVGKKVEARER